MATIINKNSTYGNSVIQSQESKIAHSQKNGRELHVKLLRMLVIRKKQIKQARGSSWITPKSKMEISLTEFKRLEVVKFCHKGLAPTSCSSPRHAFNNNTRNAETKISTQLLFWRKDQSITEKPQFMNK